jgi:hypothetical protein
MSCRIPKGTRFANTAPMSIRWPFALLTAAVLLSAGSPASAQPETPPPPPRSVEIDQALINLPTSMPLGRHKNYFRLTHRFARDLGQGSFGSLVDDFFSLDNGAVLGLEYRFGITSTLQAGVHRSTLGKTLQAFGRWDALRQDGRSPLALSAIVSIEGQNNLRQDPQPGASATVSRAVGTRLVLYAVPTYVHNAHTETLRLLHEGHDHDPAEPEGEGDEEEQSDAIDTFFLGLGARARLLETVAVTFEVSPRLAGYTPDTAVWAVGIEKLTRGHVLQLNFGNSFSTTPGMLARGGASGQVYLGFNLSRKF